MGGRLHVAVLSTAKVIGPSWITFDGRRLHLYHFGISPDF